MRRLATTFGLMTLASVAASCGARSPLREPAGFDVVTPDADVAVDAPRARDGCSPVDDRCGSTEVCGNGLDDDCNGRVDENCACEPGRVQPCFAGPPGRRDVGVCRDGAQVCEMSGTWGACEGGIVPREDVCNGTDNLCTGCSEQRDCPIACPTTGDPRVPDGAPLREYALRGGDFYPGSARAWQWVVRGGPCDAITRRPSFDLRNGTSQNAVLFPRLSGDYNITLRVTTPSGTVLSCTWIVHVEGRGLRIEMCYPENELLDLDLYLHRPNDARQWFTDSGTAFNVIADASCGWHNCEATLRGTGMDGRPLPRADWGYARSPIGECESGPQGAQWRALGFCNNPRLDIDNNLNEGIGLPENINVDSPRDGDSFRIMVQNFTGRLARPMVNVYCSGHRVATYGAPPDVVPRFEGTAGSQSSGAMWRPADVRVQVNAMGVTTGCVATPLHRPGESRGYDVTYGSPRY